MGLDARSRSVLVAVFTVAVNIFLVWFGLRADTLRGRPFAGVATALAVAACGVAPIGAWWMIYQSIRYERRVWLYLVLALVPFLFVWYYFSRVRGQSRASRR